MEENVSRPSGIKPPATKLPTPVSFSSSYRSQGLHEITDSQNNARSQYATAGSTGGLKRNAPAPAAVPDAKRKPLVTGTEYQGKTLTTLIAGAKNVKGSSLKDLNRPPSVNTGSFRQLSNSSFTSNSSYASSLGPNMRPPSRSHTRARSATKMVRPATSIGTREDGQGNNVHDIDETIAQMGSDYKRLKDFMETTEKLSASVTEELEASKKRVNTLEDEKMELQSDRARLKDQLLDAERQARRLQYDLEEQQSQHERRYKILDEDHKRELDLRAEEFRREIDKNEKLQQEFESRCGAEAEARLESLSQDNKELRSTLERQKRDHDHEVRQLHEVVQRRDVDVRRIEDELRKANNERFDLHAQIRGNNETIERLRKRAEDAEERLSKDKGHLGGQISLLSSTIDLKSERIQTLEEHAKKLQADCALEISSIKLAAEEKIANETALLRERLIKEEERRHKLFEQVQELKGNIRVMCRIKPPSNPEKDALIPFEPQWNEIDEDKIDGLTIPTFREDPTKPGKMVPGKPRDFNFERVFDEKCNNGDVFDEISQLVQSVMDGKKVCIFCYGQTGSGKTFTMSKRQGDGDDGVIPRTQSMIFGEMERLKTLGWEYTVEGSYLEVYQDKLYDLLASRHSKPEPLTVDPIGDELKIKGHDFTLLNDARDLDDMIKVADNNRHVAATVKNDRSSRSHSILVLKVSGVKKDENGEIIRTRKGTLNLIDLAGSEKPDKNGPDQVYKEGVQINSSLSYLRTVLSSLGQGKTEGVDFRSYTLTQLLRPSLGKGCRTLMFVMVSPLKENENETIRSLEFARDAQKVKMGGNGAAKSQK
ncbi:P-loop containing nucleoside triphosphate hydrolase protein [Xylaria digitata]|nr:P-loop containing nucleoside triphosphate hydrolase protein [Xylaria digitata]